MPSSPTIPAVARKHYAHSLAGRPEEEWQLLEDHLDAVADLAEAFASSFASGYGRLAGLWHDAGKYQKEFQDYIRKDPEAHVSDRVDHSTVGALIAVERRMPLVGFVVAGHHGGLPNAGDLGAHANGCVFGALQPDHVGDLYRSTG